MAALDKPSDIYGAGDGPEWRRRVAIAVNWILGPLERRLKAVEGKEGFPFPSRPTAPASPVAGQSYYDTATNKARVYDGTVWHDLF